MREISFTVPGIPQPRQAHKLSRKGGKVWKYLPAKSRVYQDRISAYGLMEMRKRKLKPLGGAIALEVLFVFPAPERQRKAQREAIERGKFLPYLSKDIDNTLKCLLDGLKGVVIIDDRFVVDLGASKRMGKTPATIITVRTIAEEAK